MVSRPAEPRAEVTFRSGDEECAAWLYRADEPGPMVIMAHGLGGTREMGLDAFATRFVAAGLSVLVFDYRHFGASGGEPRELLDIRRQLADWAAAIAYVRSLPEVDADRIALWGSSFGGGHVLATAARDGGIAAVVAQCPYTSGPASMRALGLRSILKLAPDVVRDQLGAFLRRRPVLVPLAGPPGSATLMTSPDAEPGCAALRPQGTHIPDRVIARIGLHIGRYLPGRAARRITCPTLFAICAEDAVAPPGPTRRYAARAPRATIVEYPIGHFAIYRGEPFENAIRDQLEFLLRELLPERTAGTDNHPPRTDSQA